MISKVKGVFILYEIKLPTLDWFLYGNIYSGSLRPDPTKGCLCQTTFHYKVKAAEGKHGKHIIAMCYFMLPWDAVSNMEEAFVGQFEATEFGIEVAENWIRSKFITESFPLPPLPETLPLNAPKTVRLLC